MEMKIWGQIIGLTLIIGFIFYPILAPILRLSKSFKPVVVVTWDFDKAIQSAWKTIHDNEKSAIDAIEEACKTCENLQCRGTVGYGGSPDENGETTLDAFIMDGTTMDVGAVGSLRNIKSAISVARHVLENTDHSLLVGELATEFAIHMGFKNESLETDNSVELWNKWKSHNCQPNFWKNVVPDPKNTCGPYHPQNINNKILHSSKNTPSFNKDNHDTIGIIAIDVRGNIAAGTSTNGAINKIPGRVGDSPIPGSGAYADPEVGAAAATGDGDIMMRFLPSFVAIEQMRNGISPSKAAEIAIRRIIKYYRNFSGAVIALDKYGKFGAACHGWKTFPFYASNLELTKPTAYEIPCIDSWKK